MASGSRRSFDSYSLRHQRNLIDKMYNEMDSESDEEDGNTNAANIVSDTQNLNQAAISSSDHDENLSDEDADNAGNSSNIVDSSNDSLHEELMSGCSELEIELGKYEIQEQLLFDSDTSLQTKKLQIAEFVAQTNLNNSESSMLLRILNSWGIQLPRTRSELLQTPANIEADIIPMSPGQYLHMGLEKSLIRCNYSFLNSLWEIELDICINVIKISKDSRLTVWPILASFVNNKKIPPIVIGAFLGSSQPFSIHEFLNKFIEEVDILQKRGVRVSCDDVHKTLKIRCFVMDETARAFVTGTHYHTHKYGCTKCLHVKRNGFARCIGELRTDDSFRTRSFPEHHIILEQTPLEKIGVNIITQTPLDPMQLVDLGVTKKIMEFIILGDCFDFYLSDDQAELLDKRICSLSCYIPSDFSRKGRSLNEFYNYKPSEFRLILLYTGIVFWKDILPENLYVHWLTLHCAYRILASPRDCVTHFKLAGALIENFVYNFPKFFDSKRLSYNVHNLLHLADCVKNFGDLGSFSTYPYKNYMRVFSKILKCENRVLEQLHDRTIELSIFKNETSNLGFFAEVFPGCTSTYYGCQFEDFFLKSGGRDCYCIMNDGTYFKISSFGYDATNKIKIVSGAAYLDCVDYFINPIKSSVLGIFVASKLSKLHSYNVSNIVGKLVGLPLDDKIILIPLLHNYK